MRHDRLIDISPCSDIDRRVLIRIRNMSTGDTSKTGLGFAIGFVAMSARRALARGIAGINRLDHHAFPLRFVFDKRLKLKERPTAVFSSVGFPYRRPFADLLEILKRNAAPGVFGFLDELFGNNVVLIPPESRFVAPDTLQVATRRARPAGLQVFPQGMVTTPGIFNRFTRERFAVRITGDLHDAKVNADKPFRVNRRSGGHFDHQQQIKHPVHQHQIRLSMPTAHLKALVLAHLHRDGQPTLQGQDTGRFQALEAQNPLVVNHGPGRLEKAWFRLVALVGVNHFGNRPNGQLGRQPKLVPNKVIHPLLQNKLGRALFPEGDFGDEVTRRVKNPHRLPQGSVLGVVREQLDLQYGFHIDGYIHKGIEKSNRPASDRALRGALSLPGVNAGASRANPGDLFHHPTAAPRILLFSDQCVLSHGV